MKGVFFMNETLEDLKNKRIAVMGSFNDLYDDLRLEIYENTIKEYKERIRALENDLDIYRQLLSDEVKRANQYKEQWEFMKRVKTIEVK